MEVIDNIMISNIISDSLTQAISYNDYRTLVSQLVEEQSTTGNEKTESLINYTMLNDRRMRRWDKTVKLSDDAKAKIQNFKK